MKKTIILTSLIALTTSAIAAKSPVVATVSGTAITKTQFEKEYTKHLLNVSTEKVSKEGVLDKMIARVAGIKKAKKAGLQNNAIVKEKMETILYHAQISKDLEPKFKKIVVTDKDVSNYYKNFPEYRTAQILFRLPINAKKDVIKSTLKQALKVYNTLKTKPETFSQLANRFSQTSNAPNGGDTGFQPAIRLAPQYFSAINKKSNGYITSPVETQFGIHIIKVLGVKSEKDINTALYKKIVYDGKRDKILNNYFRELRNKSNVKVNKSALK